MANPKMSGIYEIVNIASGKRYIGSAKSFARRWNVHRCRLRRGNHHSAHLQNAWNKYGEEGFQFRILRLCEIGDLVVVEQELIDTLRPEYNMSPTAGSTIGVEFSPERRAKISAALMGRKRDPAVVEASASKLRGRKLPEGRIAHLIGNLHALGSKHSDEVCAAKAERQRQRYESGTLSRERPPEYREKIAASLRGRKLSPEHRAKVAAAMTGKKRGPYKKKAATE